MPLSRQLHRFPAPMGAFQGVRGYISAVTGDRAGAMSVLADLEKLSQTRYIPAYALATVYAGLGMKNEAFAQIDRAVAERSAYLDYLGVEPTLDRLRNDPRFLASSYGVSISASFRRRGRQPVPSPFPEISGTPAASRRLFLQCCAAIVLGAPAARPSDAARALRTRSSTTLHSRRIVPSSTRWSPQCCRRSGLIFLSLRQRSPRVC